LRGETTVNSYFPTGEVGGIISLIETKLTDFKTAEAISMLNEVLLPCILLTSIAENNIEVFD
jgi:hypothetical protein